MKVFVVMPFSDEYRDIYELGVKAACKSYRVECARVDDQIFSEKILERIYAQISQADLILAVMTGRNPNVFYEVGYAHGLRKRVIFVIHDAKEIPFDLRDYPHIVYGGSISILKSKLSATIRHYKKSPEMLGGSADSPLLLHKYSGEWSIVTEFKRWRRINIKDKDQVIFKGSMILLLPPDGRDGHGRVTGHLDVRIGACKARFSIVDEIRDASVDSRGSLLYTTNMTFRHRIELSGSPPQEDGFEPELHGIVKGDELLERQKDSTMKGTGRYKSFGRTYTTAVTTIRRATP